MRYGMLRFVFCFILIAAGFWQAELASAQTDKQLSVCDDPNATDDQTISGCTAGIQSGRYSGGVLAIIFYNRGFAYDNKSEYDRAIQDYDQAVKLNQNYAKAFSNRGLAYYNKGQYDRAIQDYDQAIKLNPNDAKAFRNRGLAKAKKGDKAGAEVDLATARRIDPNVDK